MTRVLLSFMVAMLCLASSLFAQDTTPPTIFCPGNSVLQLSPGACEIVHNFSVFATDDSPGCTPNITQTDVTGLTSGSSFPIGTTVLSFKATDCSGNMATCSFSITVNAYVPQSNGLVCDDELHISLPGECETWLTPDQALEGSYGCYDDFSVYIENTGSNYIGYNYLNETITFMVVNNVTGNTCWGEALVEDKSGPSIYGCEEDTINCLQDVRPVSEGGDIPDPIFLDCHDFTVQYVDMVTQGDCEDDFSQVIMRIWSATDDEGYNSTCNQMIYVERTSLLDLEPQCPEEYITECVPGIAPNVSPEVAGYPTVEIDGIIYEITEGANAVCNITASHSDLTIPKCGVGFRVIRTWTVLDWCLPLEQGVNPWTCTQIIHYNDNTPPVVTAPANMTVTANLAGCRARPIIPASAISDCSNYSVIIFTPVGPISGNGGQIPSPGLPIGVHTITVKVTDACGHSTSVSFTITVNDLTKPSPVCDEFTIVALDDTGYAFSNAITFDDGSTDNCCIDEFKAARVTDNCGNPANLVYDDYVEFCCSDVGDSIEVVLRVYDCHGNFNTCNIWVMVQDNSGPSISCPPNRTLNCGQDYTNPNLVGEVVDDPANQGPIDGLAQDNCGDDITIDYTDSGTAACGAGTIYRTWSATDPAGTASTCTQVITILNNNPFTGANIIFPADITLNGCSATTDPTATGSPILPATNGCANLIAGYDDLPFNNVQDACQKILRTWTVIDWCQFDPSDPFGTGVWQHTQVIMVIDNAGPTFASCANRTFCNFKDDCSPLAPNLSVTVSDLCTPANQIYLTWTVDLYDDGVADPGWATSGIGQNITNDYPVGTHRISYAAEDACSNVTYCNFLFEIEDCKAPTPVCIDLIVEIMPTGMVPMNASALVDPSTNDNCTDSDDLLISFSPDTNFTQIIFTCDELGVNVVQVWVTDEDGNQDFCETTITVQDNMGACAGPLIALNGAVTSEEDLGVHGVEVQLNGNLTSQTTTSTAGAYQFANLPMGFDYTVTPQFDENPLNGVSTYDLLLINSHVLGSVLLDSPYKIIAADANRSGNVSVSDIVELRKLILHSIDELPNNTSWRFVDAGFTFANPLNPFAAIFPEVCNVNNLTVATPSVNFIAIKVGDVNGNASLNLFGAANEDRNGDNPFTLRTADRTVKAGETVAVDFSANLTNMLGYQFTMNFDNQELRFEKLVPSKEMGIDNFGLSKLESGVVTVSWNQLAAAKIATEEVQFTMTFTATKNGKLSELLGINSNYTIAESYERDGSVRPVALEFVSDNGSKLVGTQFELYQNVPNPFTQETLIRFQLPAASGATLTVFDVQGKVVKQVTGEFAKGYHEVSIGAGTLPSHGIYYYRLETPSHTATKKMTLLN